MSEQGGHKWMRNPPSRRWQSRKGSVSFGRRRDPEGLGALAAGWKGSRYQVTCLSSKQNVYGLLFDNNNERLEEDKLKCICSDKYDMLCPVDQESNDAVCDNLEMCVEIL